MGEKKKEKPRGPEVYKTENARERERRNFWSVREFCCMKKNGFFLDTFSKNSSKELICSIMLFCHKDISLESKTIIRQATRQPNFIWVKISE